ncbi:MAG: hypothetical protein JNL70_11440 [Saprospiraceae bacterium]|nr:hypothetical protein [Saprospiraceae bacterium]
MTAQEIKLIKNSWSLFRHVKPEIVADTFYSRLFFAHPELRPLFPKDMTQQYEKLIVTLTTVVARLERLHELTEDIAAMASRHSGYGVQASHYAHVGEALLWTLERGLGNDWDDKTAAAWTKCYNILADTMIGATVETPQ